jgi:hypothetical protein
VSCGMVSLLAASCSTLSFRYGKDLASCDATTCLPCERYLLRQIPRLKRIWLRTTRALVLSLIDHPLTMSRR